MGIVLDFTIPFLSGYAAADASSGTHWDSNNVEGFVSLCKNFSRSFRMRKILFGDNQRNQLTCTFWNSQKLYEKEGMYSY